jgi:hypothetical protein
LCAGGRGDCQDHHSADWKEVMSDHDISDCQLPIAK